MSERLKGCFWPDELKVGCAKIQREMNCDPRIAAIFPTHLVCMRRPSGPVYVREASIEEWKMMAKVWEQELQNESLGTSTRYH